ncbi:MAG TPA: hypothetical protein VIG64_09345 [Actinomycetota bacterium]
MTQVAWTTVGLLAVTMFGSFWYLGNKIDAINARLDAINGRIDGLAARLDARIDELATRLDARIDTLTTRIDSLESSVHDHIRRHHTA